MNLTEQKGKGNDMSKMIKNYAQNLAETVDEMPVMMEYASIVMKDNPQERKNNLYLRREKHFKYRDRNRRKKVG